MAIYHRKLIDGEFGTPHHKVVLAELVMRAWGPSKPEWDEAMRNWEWE